MAKIRKREDKEKHDWMNHEDDSLVLVLGGGDVSKAELYFQSVLSSRRK